MNWSPLAFNEITLDNTRYWYIGCTYLTDAQRVELERQLGQPTNRDLTLVPCEKFNREQITLVVKLVLAIY